MSSEHHSPSEHPSMRSSEPSSHSSEPSSSSSDAASSDAYQRAVQLLHACKSPHGFVASPTEHRNYHRVWARDGAIIARHALEGQAPFCLELIDERSNQD